MNDKTKEEHYKDVYYDIVLKETQYWIVGIRLKYSNEMSKFLFDDEASARAVYDQLLKQYKDNNDFKLNVDTRVFSFTSKGNCNTTLNLDEVVAFSVQPPIDQMDL